MKAVYIIPLALPVTDIIPQTILGLIIIIHQRNEEPKHDELSVENYQEML